MSIDDQTFGVPPATNGKPQAPGRVRIRTEPLPADSPLWDLPNVIITPHTAGGRPRGAADLVAANLDAYRAGRPLTNEIDR